MKTQDKTLRYKQKPRGKSFLPFYRPSLSKEEEKEVINTLRSGWIGKGPKTEAFEDAVKEYTGSKYAVGVNSCTAGLHLSLMAMGVGKGDEVITSPMTFPATVNVIFHQGAKPVFVDIVKDNLTIDTEKIKKKITSKTKAVIAVHFAGHPCEMNEILRLAKEYNLFVIEDAAHALGSEYRGKKIGGIGHLTCFSFYATKNITTGEGGMVTTNNRDFFNKIMILSLHGLSKNAWKREKSGNYAQPWETVLPGFKYNMYDLQASIGIVQLRKIENFIEIRKQYSQIYAEAFLDMPEIIILKRKNYVKCAYHLFVIMVKTEDLTANRREIIKALWRENIQVGIHYKAVHLHPFYKRTFSFKGGDFPVAEYASDRVISLPLYPNLREEDVRRVIRNLRKIIFNYKKRKYYGFRK